MRALMLFASIVVVSGCHGDGLGPPAVACGDLKDEASCSADEACQVDACEGCDGVTTFVGCVDASTLILPCSTVCPQKTCGAITDAATCNASPACHTIYTEPACECAAVGCCAHFDSCAEGPAQCAADSLPACPLPPNCDGTKYVVGYAGGCAEGCVLASACGL
jgi:hypothetical protein